MESNYESRNRYLLSLKQMVNKQNKIRVFETNYELKGLLAAVDPNSSSIAMEQLETKTGLVKQCRIRLSDVLYFGTEL